MSTTDYIRLENQLVLVAWLNHLLGYEHNQDLLKDLVDTKEGWDSTGRHHITRHLLARDGCRLSEADLVRYDANIRSHLNAMNRGRMEKISLRYFQYLAALCTEIFIDRLMNHPRKLATDLNRFVAERKAKRADQEGVDLSYTADDLRKLAFWMATGSGKTLLMHLNFRQFLHYNKTPLDNILLITPNEGLTLQHLEQLASSGITAERFDLQDSGLLASRHDVVRVIEITKLVEEKRGGGVSVPVEAFQGNNLIFVDEGHKGSGGEIWRGYRDQLGVTGFTFEYSATFGQALNAAGRDEVTREYAKCIGFDYSYRYFYGDGFGKDFSILNLRRTNRHEEVDVLLLANLLSFYEQVRYFDKNESALKPYNLAQPLWIFVGSKVTAIYTEHGRKRSDVLTIVQFLDRFLKNEGGWSVQTIQNVLGGKSGLKMESGADLFANDLLTLKDGRQTGAVIFKDIVVRLFRAAGPAGLELNAIRGADGELGLRVRGTSRYFGVIYVGDTSAFRELVKEHAPEVGAEDDAITGALFPTINRAASDIRVLIGAKKFIEGWDSWRVSSMCLLNVGRGEGSEIIQLFGRGVRLKGTNGSLKRSTAIRDKTHPENIKLLERLNIFAVKADYMSQFRNFLEKEGVETDGYVELDLPLWDFKKFSKEDLYVPRWPDESTFKQEQVVLLKIDEKAAIRHDISSRVETIVGTRGTIGAGGAVMGASIRIPGNSFSLLDWERVHHELLAYRETAGFDNLLIPRDAPETIMRQREPDLYELIADEDMVKPVSLQGIRMLEAIVTDILKRYVDSFYRLEQRRWDGQRLDYRKVSLKETDLAGYKVHVPAGDAELVKAVKKLLNDKVKRLREGVKELPNLQFDRHIYQPLLVEAANGLSSSPPGLNEGEKQFVDDLRDYCLENPDGGRNLFLMRNLSRGKGIGFFESAGFYPDFILWIKEDKKQRIIFVEPHGMVHEAPPHVNEKVGLHKRLKADAGHSLKKLKHVSVDAFVVSKTPYEKLRKHWVHDDGTPWSRAECAAEHVLFPERTVDYDYIEALLIS